MHTYQPLIHTEAFMSSHHGLELLASGDGDEKFIYIIAGVNALTQIGKKSLQ